MNLTDIDGLFDKDPRVHGNARLVRTVEKVDREMLRYASGIPGFLGTGGMAAKIKAARKATLGGVPAVIANGLRGGVLQEIFTGKEVGTLFLPQEDALCSRKQWIAFTRAQKGKLVIDRGAERALTENGKSLLPSGILEVRGKFSQGDSVALLSEAGETMAVGMVNYHSGDIRKIAGLKSREIESVLGFKHEDEVIHRDNLVIITDMEEGEEVCLERA